MLEDARIWEELIGVINWQTKRINNFWNFRFCVCVSTCFINFHLFGETWKSYWLRFACCKRRLSCFVIIWKMISRADWHLDTLSKLIKYYFRLCTNTLQTQINTLKKEKNVLRDEIKIYHLRLDCAERHSMEEKYFKTIIDRVALLESDKPSGSESFEDDLK